MMEIHELVTLYNTAH